MMGSIHNREQLTTPLAPPTTPLTIQIQNDVNNYVLNQTTEALKRKSRLKNIHIFLIYLSSFLNGATSILSFISIKYQNCTYAAGCISVISIALLTQLNLNHSEQIENEQLIAQILKTNGVNDTIIDLPSSPTTPTTRTPAVTPSFNQ